MLKNILFVGLGVAITYIAITLLACLLITWAGMYVGKKLL